MWNEKGTQIQHLSVLCVSLHRFPMWDFIYVRVFSWARSAQIPSPILINVRVQPTIWSNAQTIAFAINLFSIHGNQELMLCGEKNLSCSSSIRQKKSNWKKSEFTRFWLNQHIDATFFEYTPLCRRNNNENNYNLFRRKQNRSILMRKWQQFVCIFKLLLSVFAFSPRVDFVKWISRYGKPEFIWLMWMRWSFTLWYGSAVAMRIVWAAVRRCSYMSKWHIWKIAVRWEQHCIKFDIFVMYTEYCVRARIHKHLKRKTTSKYAIQCAYRWMWAYF